MLYNAKLPLNSKFVVYIMLILSKWELIIMVNYILVLVVLLQFLFRLGPFEMTNTNYFTLLFCQFRSVHYFLLKRVTILSPKRFSF